MTRLRTTTLRIAVGPKIIDYLEQLVDTGLYGSSVGDAAERLICRRLDDLLTEDARSIQRPMLREV